MWQVDHDEEKRGLRVMQDQKWMVFLYYTDCELGPIEGLSWLLPCNQSVLLIST